MGNTVLQNKLIDRVWEDGIHAKKIREWISDGLHTMSEREIEWLGEYLNHLPGTYEVDKEGTKWYQYVARLRLPSTTKMESGQDMGCQHAAEFYPQHTKGGSGKQLVATEDDDHVLAELIGGVSRKAVASGDMYKPHDYTPTSVQGAIGSPCLFCAGGPEAPQHNDVKALPEGTIRVQAIDDKVAGCIRIEIDNPPTEEARDILLNILPAVLEAWLLKNKDYGDSDDLKSLGAKAEFVRIWNKVMKLRASLWEGKPLEGEQPDEIMGDLVAHLLLALSRLAE